MWELEPTDEYDERFRKWPKKHRRELAAMLANLDTVLRTLNRGAKAQHLLFGFMHHEPNGVKAVDQKGGGQGLKECRLYLYPDVESQTVHLLTLGDKDSQGDDIRNCSYFVETIKKHGN